MKIDKDKYITRDTVFANFFEIFYQFIFYILYVYY